MSDPLTIEARPRSARERMRQRLRGRKLTYAGIVALAEVIAILVWRPSAVLLLVLAVAVLVVSVMLATRVPPGLLRDALWIIAIAQTIVVVIPLVVGVGLVIGLVVAIVLLIGFVAIAIRWRV